MSFVSERFANVVKDSKSAGGDLYLNPSSLGDGESVRFSPLGDKSLEFFEIWGRNSEGKAKSLRFPEEPTDTELNDRANDEGIKLVDQRGNPSKLKPALAFWVWDYGTSSVRLFQASQVTILETLAGLFCDEDVAADPSAWDFELSRTGTGQKDTKYSVMLKPGKRKGTVKAEVDAAWEECVNEGYNLDALLSGGDPTKMPF